jgi:transcriptional regulatory protein RtcR
MSDAALWPGNFRDLNAVITRLATLAPAGRITSDQVNAEVAHLKAVWTKAGSATLPGLVDRVMPPGSTARLDRFDRVQLEDVLQVCHRASSLSAAGRALFDRSRERKKTANDADRLRKYLARFDLEWAEVKQRLGSENREPRTLEPQKTLEPCRPRNRGNLLL